MNNESVRTEEPVDELYGNAVEVVLDAGRGSTQLLQRKLDIGYARASRIIQQLKARGVLGEYNFNCYPILESDCE